MKYLITNIQYDTDGQDIDLPKVLLIDVEDDEEDVQEYLSDEISNITDYCHFGFDFEQTEVISLQEYGKRIGCKEDYKTLQEIQDRMQDEYDCTLWDYPLEELEHTKENCEATILVETDFGIRICEV